MSAGRRLNPIMFHSGGHLWCVQGLEADHSPLLLFCFNPSLTLSAQWGKRVTVDWSITSIPGSIATKKKLFGFLLTGSADVGQSDLRVTGGCRGDYKNISHSLLLSHQEESGFIFFNSDVFPYVFSLTLSQTSCSRQDSWLRTLDCCIPLGLTQWW